MLWLQRCHRAPLELAEDADRRIKSSGRIERVHVFGERTRPNRGVSEGELTEVDVVVVIPVVAPRPKIRCAASVYADQCEWESARRNNNISNRHCVRAGREIYRVC